jgi:hypothetical protein
VPAAAAAVDDRSPARSCRPWPRKPRGSSGGSKSQAVRQQVVLLTVLPAVLATLVVSQAARVSGDGSPAAVWPARPWGRLSPARPALGRSLGGGDACRQPGPGGTCCQPGRLLAARGGSPPALGGGGGLALLTPRGPQGPADGREAVVVVAAGGCSGVVADVRVEGSGSSSSGGSRSSCSGGWQQQPRGSSYRPQAAGQARQARQARRAARRQPASQPASEPAARSFSLARRVTCLEPRRNARSGSA